MQVGEKFKETFENKVIEEFLQSIDNTTERTFFKVLFIS